jgi:MFS family permease
MTASRPAGVATRDLVVLSAAFFFIFGGTGCLQQYLTPYLEQTRHWDPVRASLVLTVLYGSFLVWRVLAIYTIRALGDYWSIILGTLTYTLFPVAIASSGRIDVALVAAAVWGWGAASLWITSTAQVLDAAQRSHYGRASGAFYGATHVGYALGLLALGALVRAYPEGRVFLYGAAAITGFGNLVCLWVPRRRFERDLPNVLQVLRISVAREGLVVGALQFASSLSYGLLLGLFAAAITARYELKWVGIFTLGFYVVRAVMSPLSGAVCDRVGTRQVLVYSFLASGVGLALPALWARVASLVGSSAVLGVQAAAVPVGVMAYVGEISNSSKRQATIAGMYVWRDAGVAAAVLASAYLREAFGTFRGPFLVFGAVFVLCGILATRLPRAEAKSADP